jgi:hypothetical protein
MISGSVFEINRRDKNSALNWALSVLPALQAPANSGAPAIRHNVRPVFSRTPIYLPLSLYFFP